MITDANGDVTVVTYETVGTYAEVYANIEYNIFDVLVFVDSGIGSVAIDNNVLVNVTGNVFMTTTSLSAGVHSITYSLKTGYQGEASLTVNGDNATVSGLTFTLSGTPAYGTITVQLSLSGTTASDPSIIINGGDSPAASDDGMGITDYLLIILVVLIIVMAVIVVLRLRRS